VVVAFVGKFVVFAQPRLMACRLMAMCTSLFSIPSPNCVVILKQEYILLYIEIF
jgi:hypothetical protein